MHSTKNITDGRKKLEQALSLARKRDLLNHAEAADGGASRGPLEGHVAEAAAEVAEVAIELYAAMAALRDRMDRAMDHLVKYGPYAPGAVNSLGEAQMAASDVDRACAAWATARRAWARINLGQICMNQDAWDVAQAQATNR